MAQLALSSHRLVSLLEGATGGRVGASEVAPKPAILDIPDFGTVRVYLWTTTPDQSAVGRPAGEYKSQIILPGTERGSTQHLVLSGMPTFLVGYSPLHGLFVFWEARRHQAKGYSGNLQVKEDLLQEGVRTGWAIDAPRRTDAGSEVRAVIHPAMFTRYLEASVEADARGLEGEARQAFLASMAPDLRPHTVQGSTDLKTVVRTRERVLMERLKREAGFAHKILPLFKHSCAVCELQMNVLDAAHVLPVTDERGSEDAWNGLALCKNHHWLFDRRILRIDARTVVKSDPETIEMLNRLGRLGGYESILGAHLNKPLRRLPIYFGVNKSLTDHFTQALHENYRRSPAG